MNMEPSKDMTGIESILWRGFVLPGHEACRLFSQNSLWHVEGTAVFIHEKQPVRLNYQIICDTAWQTLSAEVEGWLGNSDIRIEIKTDPTHHWWLNGIEQPAVMSCIDLDLNFSPSTNLLPIRRLAPEVGQSVTVRAAWLRFPSFKLEPLEQVYTRLEPGLYRYESAGGRFVAPITVDDVGLVKRYGDLWMLEQTAA